MLSTPAPPRRRLHHGRNHGLQVTFPLVALFLILDGSEPSQPDATIAAGGTPYFMGGCAAPDGVHEPASSDSAAASGQPREAAGPDSQPASQSAQIDPSVDSLPRTHLGANQLGSDAVKAANFSNSAAARALASVRSMRVTPAVLVVLIGRALS